MAEKLRARLARRLRDLMDADPALETQTKVHKATGLAQSTIQRLLAQEQAATVDVIDQLAPAFGFNNAWHMLLDQEHIDLIEVWSRLTPDERQRAFGYLYVTANVRTMAMPPQAPPLPAARADPGFLGAAPDPVIPGDRDPGTGSAMVRSRVLPQKQ